jgi:hypothetical protein
MNDKTSGRRRWPGRAGILALAVGIALLTAACGGGTSSGASGSSSTYRKALAFSECMRSHGVTDFPDPNSNGTFPVTRNLGGGTPSAQSRSQMQSATNACRSLAPGAPISQAQQARNLKQSLKFVACMRKHGVPNMPDPSSNGSIPVNGINPQSPQFLAAEQACKSLLPGAAAGAVAGAP